MARKKAGKENVQIVLEEDDDEEEVGIKGGGVERYEVRIEPPMVRGRKAKAVRTPGVESPTPGTAPAPPQNGSQVRGANGMAVPISGAGSTQQIYKIEDDLRRTRDVVEDLKHTVGVMESDFNDLRAEMDRISYLLRSLEGLKNTMKDIESTVSELSGLYDMISANVNPFIDIPPMMPANGNGKPAQRPDDKLVMPEEDKVDESGFRELSDIFDEEEAPELEDMDEVDDNNLRSAEWILKWTQFLIERVGKEGLEKTLDYYIEMGWIDDDTADTVVDIAKGTIGPRRRDDGKKVSWKLGADDHVKSLEYIRRIKGI
jgi:hypothetical protein